jgi:hypothetical protein
MTIKTRTTNPYGANQYLLDPRQKYCWDSYIDPRSDTFSNALKSAVKAGYSESTASHITREMWFVEKTRRLGFLSKSEQILEDILGMPIITTEWQGSGKEKVEVMVTDVSIIKLKQDTAKFICERLGKNEGYTTKQELQHTGTIDLITGNRALDDLFEDEDIA